MLKTTPLDCEKTAILGDARTHPPDRGKGAAEAQASEPKPEAAELFG